MLEANISRRSWLKATSALCLGLLSPQVRAGSPQRSFYINGGPVREGQTLSLVQMRQLRAMCETIIPTTNTPGAADADVHGFIDDQLTHCQSKAKADAFIAQFNRVNQLVAEQFGQGFAHLNSQQQHQAMTALAQSNQPFGALGGRFFSQLKALTLLGYYLSEIGASKELIYDPVPGGFNADFRLSDNQGKGFMPEFYSN